MAFYLTKTKEKSIASICAIEPDNGNWSLSKAKIKINSENSFFNERLGFAWRMGYLGTHIGKDLIGVSSDREKIYFMNNYHNVYDYYYFT